MQFNDLDKVILQRTLAIASGNCDQRTSKGRAALVTMSSVCRAWRAFLLPCLYRTIFASYAPTHKSSNAMLALGSGHIKHARALVIDTKDVPIENLHVAQILKLAGIDQLNLPQIKRLEIHNSLHPDQIVSDSEFVMDIDRLVYFLSKLLPNITEIQCSQRILDEDLVVTHTTCPAKLLSALADAYSTNVQELNLGMYIDGDCRDLHFPQQLTHLTVSMDRYEKMMLPNIFASSLKYLKIVSAPAAITWSWFYTGEGRHVWFKKLKEFEIEFSRLEIRPRQTYHGSVLSRVEGFEFSSDYRQHSKIAHFPALEKLRVSNYPYDDDVFYKVFCNCPLKSIDIKAPNGVKYQIPYRLLNNLTNMRLQLEHRRSEFYKGRAGSQTFHTEKNVYFKELARLVNTPSTARMIHLGLENTSKAALTLPRNLAWNATQHLELTFSVDVPSVIIILQQMPSLRILRCCLMSSNLNKMYERDPVKGKLGKGNRVKKLVDVVNKRVEHIAFNIGDINNASLSQSGFRCCLSNVLPCVPSLVKLFGVEKPKAMADKPMAMAKLLTIRPMTSAIVVYAKAAMAGASLAQSLPVEVLEAIIHHATGLRKVLRTQYSESRPELSKELIPFLSVCSRWRSVALPIFYMDMEVEIRGADELRAVTHQRLVHGLDDMIISSAFDLVRCAEILVPCRGIVDGEVAELLSSEPYSSAVFPSAFHLRFITLDMDSPRGNRAESSDNIARLCQCIRKMFPNLISLFVDNNLFGFIDEHNFASSICAQLATPQLCAFNYSGYEGGPHMQDLHQLASLTHLNLAVDIEYLDVVELVHRNAPILQRLSLRYQHAAAFVGLVQGFDGAAIVYPCLKQLAVSASYEYQPTLPVSPEGTPFPVLSYLTCTDGYPFDNDVLFRGSNKTLEFLVLSFTPELTQAVHNFQIFNNGRYPELKYMALQTMHGFSVDDDFAQYLIRVPFDQGPKMQAVNIRLDCDVPCSVLVDAIQNATLVRSIKELDIHNFKLTVQELVGIIRNLPNLQYVGIGMAEEPAAAEERLDGAYCLALFSDSYNDDNDKDADADAGAALSLLDFSLLPALHQERCLASSRLRSVHFESELKSPSLQTVANLLMVASLIPSLKFVAGSWLSAKRGRTRASQVLSHPSLAPYEKQLRSLTYIPRVDRLSSPVAIL
ncbi:hypothetical protein GGI12_004075 [Dipsacomyces acuminosporus]|nr:hypothetical protein GGI12_004075 [Dipsacomyces acuminosporus]